MKNRAWVHCSSINHRDAAIDSAIVHLFESQSYNPPQLRGNRYKRRIETTLLAKRVYMLKISKVSDCGSGHCFLTCTYIEYLGPIESRWRFLVHPQAVSISPRGEPVSVIARISCIVISKVQDISTVWRMSLFIRNRREICVRICERRDVNDFATVLSKCLFALRSSRWCVQG
jgi:hypothetical protein